jgi:uncharacterized membrane protein
MKRWSTVTLWIASVALALLAPVVGIECVFAQQAYFMGLGDLPGGDFSSQPNDISADGSVIVGSSAAGAGNDTFRWTRETGIVGLGINVSALRISGDGTTIIGNTSDSSDTQPFRWTQESGFEIGPPGIYIVRGISHDGTTIVGQTDSPRHGARWVEGLGTEPLFTDLASTVAWDVSADGSVIVGNNLDSGVHVFVWSNADGRTFLNVADASTTTLRISDNGKVVTGSSTAGAWRWMAETGTVYLGSLPDGKVSLVARAVSADGSIVAGNSELDLNESIQGLASRPMIWDAAHGSRYLFDVLSQEYGLGPALDGWRNVGHVRAISADGKTLTGVGVNRDGFREAWVAFLGTPVPEPHSALLAVLSVLALWAVRSRR